MLPACGGVGAQYTPAAGWAQAIRYHREALRRQPRMQRSIAVVLGGDASVATGGFWSALTMATTLRLPMLFYIEDNGFGISVPSLLQTPGGNIAANLRSFSGLTILEGDGADPRAGIATRGRSGPARARGARAAAAAADGAAALRPLRPGHAGLQVAGDDLARARPRPAAAAAAFPRSACPVGAGLERAWRATRGATSRPRSSVPWRARTLIRVS